MLKEYRCTREEPYRYKPIFPPLESRQGYYVTAFSAEDALEIMAKRFPGDIKEGYWFTIQFG
jgi:hypothetical protein